MVGTGYEGGKKREERWICQVNAIHGKLLTYNFFKSGSGSPTPSSLPLSLHVLSLSILPFSSLLLLPSEPPQDTGNKHLKQRHTSSSFSPALFHHLHLFSLPIPHLFFQSTFISPLTGRGLVLLDSRFFLISHSRATERRKGHTHNLNFSFLKSLHHFHSKKSISFEQTIKKHTATHISSFNISNFNIILLQFRPSTIPDSLFHLLPHFILIILITKRVTPKSDSSAIIMKSCFQL